VYTRTYTVARNKKELLVASVLSTPNDCDCDYVCVCDWDRGTAAVAVTMTGCDCGSRCKWLTMLWGSERVTAVGTVSSIPQTPKATAGWWGEAHSTGG